MGQKKRIKRLLTAVKGAFKGVEYRKKLKQAEVFEDLLERLVKRRDDLASKLKDKSLSKSDHAKLKEKLLVLEAEIPKADRILSKLKKN
jgi:hypothetical protein